MIQRDDFAYYGYKINDKINFLLAVSTNKMINYKFTKMNTNTKVFKNFFLETIKELDGTLFVMDNHVSHISKEIFELVNNEKIELYTKSKIQI